MTRTTKAALGFLGAFALLQLVRFEQANPPVTADLVAPAEVTAILRRACYDCHSNETRWPWYGQVAPVSWLLHRDVVDGRKHLNFSDWSAAAEDRRARRRTAIVEEVSEGEMPPWFYVAAHPAARLSANDIQILRAWAGPGGDERPSDRP